jgi:hypothetical protein
MAYINKDVSTMAMPSGMNRMGQFPLDMSSVYYDLESLQAYATSGAVAYVGQILSLVDETNNNVTLYAIKNTAGDLVEIAADIVMPEVPEYTGEGAINVADYKINVAVDNETIKIVDGKLTAIIPEVEIPEYVDTNTTYGFAFNKETQKLTVTPSEGEAVELDLSDFLIASELPEDKNTEYHLEYVDKAIKLVAGADSTKMSIDATPFIKDGMLSDVDYDPTSNTLTFVWNTDSGLKADTVVLSDILDPYVAGDKIVIDGSKISHATIAAPALVEGGSGRTYITELVSDGFGHITGYKVATEADQVIPEYVDGDGIEVRDEEGSTHSINIKLADGESHLKFTDDGALAFDATGIDTDTNTTYGISANGVSVTLTPSEGDATTVTLDAYTKSETDTKIDEKIASVTGGESAADVKLALETYRDAINTELWGENAKAWTSTTTDEDGKVITVYNPQYGTTSRLDTVEAKLLTVEENAQVNKIESADSNFVITAAKQLTLAEGKHLITDAQIAKLNGVAEGAEKNFISSVDEAKFTVTEGKLLLKENYVTTTVYSAEVGDLTKLVRDEGRANTTLVDEINYINERLTWGEMGE